MKLTKYFLVLFIFSNVLISCTSDDGITEDAYKTSQTLEDTQANGETSTRPMEDKD